jgi:hypothetical protein
MTEEGSFHSRIGSLHSVRARKRRLRRMRFCDSQICVQTRQVLHVADSAGWLCKIKLSDPAEFETLLDSEAYKAHCSGA